MLPLAKSLSLPGRVRACRKPEGVRFLLVAGRPLQEPVAWHGPIVMNTREELATAVRQLRDGTFIQPRN